MKRFLADEGSGGDFLAVFSEGRFIARVASGEHNNNMYQVPCSQCGPVALRTATIR